VSATGPEEIYERNRREGERRLARPPVELISTALAAGVDIIAGVIAAALVTAQLGGGGGKVAGAVAFGIGFVFLVVGKGELFTENFLVPIAGLDRGSRRSWLALLRLWTISPVFNLIAAGIMILILTVHGVLPHGTGAALAERASELHARSTLALFFSAVFAGALITVMTWFVEGNAEAGVRITIAWAAGAILSLGHFDHVIVATIDLVFGRRLGADIPWSFVAGNLGLAAAGNMLGGIGLVTLNRLTQGTAGARTRHS
jgi:formate/nitrite transporter FocA (FNT family)